MYDINNTAIILLFCLFLQCSTPKEIDKNDCTTKYPIVFVHGVAYRDDVPIIKYWSNIPKIIEENGGKVYLSNQNAFNSHSDNAIQIKEKILEILNETKSDKVNIIAHSKGGIEARYMITKLEMADKVASLTTLSTPHRGSSMADTIVAFLDKKNLTKRIHRLANFYAKLIGDNNPNAIESARNLTVDYMKDFNKSVPNMPQVYYQSYGSIVNDNYPSWIVKVQHEIMQKAEGDNDCVVSSYSYKWGDFKGIVKSNEAYGISHFDIVGMKFVSKSSSFDAEMFVYKIVKDLKKKGY
ncbi:MAG: hypothetical protein JXR51_08490 [Bacteroidales bacterium]|nr:hypothetical protein [Bacteroidales bacterium]MBN2757200.1 hypothetical protein [Bacteroidales bacterium]